MTDLDINQIGTTDMTNEVTDYSVDTETTDGAADQKETTWTNTEWTQQFGYYKSIPEVNTAIDALATWTVGKGIEAKPTTKFRMDLVRGIGIDNFNTILENMIRTMQIGGDAFAEIVIRPGSDDYIVNIKPLNPENINIVANRKGIIIRYEQTDRVTKKTVKKFKPEEIFHLCRNRVADEIHGQSLVDPLVKVILFKNELLDNSKTMMQRWVKPIFIIHADTDDPTKLTAIKKAAADCVEGGENMVVPKGAIVPELMAVSGNASLNPLPMLQYLDSVFTQISRVPDVIVGGSKNLTEASSKIVYLAWQQTVEGEQLYIEEEVAQQLGYDIELIFPASLENELLSDNKKDGTVNMQPNETTAGAGV